MKVLIIGAGSLGLLFGNFFNKAGANVSIYGSASLMKYLNGNVITIHQLDKSISIDNGIQCAPLLMENSKCDYPNFDVII